MTSPHPTAPIRATPWSVLESALGFFEQRLSPPPWLVAETQGRIVLLLNHVLLSEPEGMARLKRQQGKRVQLAWRGFSLVVQATPVGLLERIDGSHPGPIDLSLTLTQTGVAELAASARNGQTPKLRIEGDVQLAAEVGWLTQNVRWDLEEDLARIVGDAAAHTLAQAARAVVGALQPFIQSTQATESEPTVSSGA